MIRTLILSLFILPFVHDFHFSRTKAHYNSETQTLQMSMNVFTDDLELAVRTCGHEALKIDVETNSVTDSLLSIYVLSKFRASHAGLPLDMEWIGYECDYDVTYVYVESEAFSLDSTLLIDQTLLMEIFDDQENVLDFESSETEVSYILIRDHHQVEIDN